MKTIIEMAREAGGLGFVHDAGDAPSKWQFTPKELKRFAELVRAEAQAEEREAIYDQWHSCVMSDLENGVKWLNEKAAAEWHKNYPAQSNLFPAWIETRGNT